MNEFVIKNGFISQGTSYVSDGNLGVGVTSPTSRLEVKGIDSSSSNFGLKVQNSGGTDNLVVRNDGYITNTSVSDSVSFLIGNKFSGDNTLKVQSDSSGRGLVVTEYTNITTGNGIQIVVSDSGTRSIRGMSNIAGAVISDLSIESTSLSIGNSIYASSAMVHIKGSDSSTGFGLKVQNSDGTDNLVVRNDGNVGIGTSSPSETLEVSGKTKTTNFQMTSGGTEDYILTSSDSQGNGKWTPSYNLSTKDYGSFYDTTTQTGGNGTIQSFQLNSSGATKGISITDLTGITVTHTGVYNIQFSAQIYDGGGTAHDVYIWLRKNGSDILNSNSRVEVGNNNNYIVAAWNFVEKFNSNDVINLMWYSESNTISILYDATPTAGPEIPSLILTITQI